MPSPNLGRLIRLIAMARTEIVRMEPRASSKSGFANLVMSMVDVVEDWVRVVVITAVCSFVVALVKMLSKVPVPVSDVTAVEVVVLVAEVVVPVTDVEVEVIGIVYVVVVVLVEKIVDGATLKRTTALLDTPQ
jgi:hypothetical protein